MPAVASGDAARSPARLVAWRNRERARAGIGAQSRLPNRQGASRRWDKGGLHRRPDLDRQDAGAEDRQRPSLAGRRRHSRAVRPRGRASPPRSRATTWSRSSRPASTIRAARRSSSWSFLKGEKLADALQRTGALPLGDVAEILAWSRPRARQTHSQGIVHRDLKPENIFLAVSRRRDVPFTAKILDFGIAKLVADSQKTGTQPLGTPLFMAPEQTDRRGKICPATDVWALGLIAFKLLAGRDFWAESDRSLPMLLHARSASSRSRSRRRARPGSASRLASRPGSTRGSRVAWRATWTLASRFPARRTVRGCSWSSSPRMHRAVCSSWTTTPGRSGPEASARAPGLSGTVQPVSQQDHAPRGLGDRGRGHECADDRHRRRRRWPRASQNVVAPREEGRAVGAHRDRRAGCRRARRVPSRSGAAAT